MQRLTLKLVFLNLSSLTLLISLDCEREDIAQPGAFGEQETRGGAHPDVIVISVLGEVDEVELILVDILDLVEVLVRDLLLASL